MNALMREPLRILAVAAGEPWPLDSGARLHLYHVLKELARHADVTLALPSDPQHRAHLPADIAIEVIPNTLGINGPTPYGRHAGLAASLARRHFGWRASLAAWLEREAHAGRFDVVLLNGALSGQYAPHCRVPVVWNPQDELVLGTLRAAEHDGWHARATALRHAALYAVYERHLAQQAAATVFVSRIDAAYARRWAPAARIEVVQNGVDLEYFQPTSAPSIPGTVAFVGALDFTPNIDGIVQFVRTAWPDIHGRGRARRLLVVGRKPAPAVRALDGLPGIRVIADVPDVRPYLTQAEVVVVPVRKGGGLKNKVLEACAMSRPVVAAPRALAGLSARPGLDVLTADSPRTWVAQVDRLLCNPTYARAIAERGRAWVRHTHRWADTGRRFLDILASAARYGRAATYCRSAEAMPALTLPAAPRAWRRQPGPIAEQEALCR